MEFSFPLPAGGGGGADGTAGPAHMGRGGVCALSAIF